MQRILFVLCTVVLVAAACTTPPTTPTTTTSSSTTTTTSTTSTTTTIPGPQVEPVAVATVAASAGAVPFSPAFSSAGSTDPDGSIVSLSWDFGDGTTSTDANPVKAYAAPGVYTASLTVTDDDGLTATSDPITLTSYPQGDPSSLVHFPELSRSVALGEDRIAVWTCEVDGSAGPVHDPDEIAAWAQSAVQTYFEVASRGRYDPVFTGMGTFQVASQTDCLGGARDRTDSPYTNAMVVDTTLVGGGLGGPGFVYSSGLGGAPGLPPSESMRGFLVGGGSYSEFPNPGVLIHEIGHTLHWPHSFLTPTNEYDNLVDLMSGRPGPQSCSVPGWIYHCEPQHTLALNRWAAGWIDPAEIAVHVDGTTQLELVGPEQLGTQLVVAPSSSSSQALVVVEARPRSGFDAILDTGGVAVHVVDQRSGMCTVTTLAGCPSLWRRQGQAFGSPLTYEHVLDAGESATVHGVTIAVGASTGSGWQVTVSGQPLVPSNALQPKAALRLAPNTTGDGRGGVMVDLP